MTSLCNILYAAIPKPLYKEVKKYIQDLLVRRWIVKSMSPYSAPVVCVRKKDRTLRLCVDYRLLNRKTVPNRHPLQRIHDLMNTLGGYSWFSILDQGKAYHQGYMAEGSRHLTASSPPGASMSGSGSPPPLTPWLHSRGVWSRCWIPYGTNAASPTWTTYCAMQGPWRTMWLTSDRF